MLLTTVFKESSGEGPRAEIHQNESGFWVEYYGHNGIQLKREMYEGKSIHYVQDVAENWVAGIKVLNG